jgi:transcriptional regulator with XRE-family HTH domain
MEIKDRLQIAIKQYNLTATLFADKIGVQRSSISHILSGRNKPSIDFIIKLNDVFPDLDITWLITGKTNSNQTDFSLEMSGTLFDSKSSENEIVNTTNKEKKITRIITFYSDNSFEEFLSNQL